MQVKSGQKLASLVCSPTFSSWYIIWIPTTDHIIAELCLVFCIIPSAAILPSSTPLGNRITGRFLAYVRHFDSLSQPDATTGLYLLKRARRSNGGLMGDIVPLDQIRALVDITPRFELRADLQLTKGSSSALSSEFWLNKYFDKELFYALHV